MRKVLFLICCGIIGFSSLTSAVWAQNNEEMTVTTYYPSPFGSYNRMDVSRSIAVGPMPAARTYVESLNSGGVTEEGTVYTSGSNSCFVFQARQSPRRFGWYSGNGEVAWLWTDSPVAPAGPNGTVFGVERNGRVYWLATPSGHPHLATIGIE
jgi:hypothetical protein